MRGERNSIFKIKSNYMLKKIFRHLTSYKLLNTIRYNKKIQNILYQDINDYKKYLQTEIEIIPFEYIYMENLSIFQIQKMNLIIIYILMII